MRKRNNMKDQKELKVISASWCTNCGNLKKQLDTLNVPYTVVDADVDMDYARKVGARSLPTSVIESNGEIIQTFIGLKAKEISEYMKG